MPGTFRTLQSTCIFFAYNTLLFVTIYEHSEAHFAARYTPHINLDTDYLDWHPCLSQVHWRKFRDNTLKYTSNLSHTLTESNLTKKVMQVTYCEQTVTMPFYWFSLQKWKKCLLITSDHRKLRRKVILDNNREAFVNNCQIRIIYT